jgi:hypothetical protein
LQRLARTLIAAIVLECSAGGALATFGKDALARLAVCTAANAFAIDTMSRRPLARKFRAGSLQRLRIVNPWFRYQIFHRAQAARR